MFSFHLQLLDFFKFVSLLETTVNHSFFAVNSWLETAINIIIKMIYHMVEASYSSELLLSVVPSGANWIGV